MAGGGLFEPFTVVLSVVLSSAGELKNMDQSNGIKLVMKHSSAEHLKASGIPRNTSEIFHALPRESVA